MEGIQVSTEVRGNHNEVSVIKVGGFIDTTTSSEVERALTSLLKQNRFNIVIDLGNVDYISSAGWGIFISEIKSIREHNGDLKLVRMIPDVYEIFELLEFHHILDVYDSVDEAVRKFEEVTHRVEPTTVTQEFSESRNSARGMSDQDRSFSSPKSDFTEVQEETFEELSGVDGGNNRNSDFTLEKANVEDKIKHIVAHSPDVGAYKINKVLNSRRYGYSKVGWFGVRSILNKLGLNSRKARREFSQRFSESDLL
jgi:anti-anti-sigma factor